MSSRKFNKISLPIATICVIMWSFGLEMFSQQITFEPVPDFFRIKREIPLIELSTTSTVNVSDYGATINDGTDDTQAITNALKFAEDNASANNPLEVKFETGIYDVAGIDGQSHTFFIERARNVVINGNNSEIILHNPTVGFMNISSSENIIIKDFIIDYDELPFTQGTVVQKNPSGNNFYLEIDEGFPMMNRPHIRNAPERWGMLKNADGSLKEGAPNLISAADDAFQFIRTNTFRYRLSNPDHLDFIDIGDKFVFIARYNGKTTFSTNNSKQVTYLRNTSYTSVAGSYNGNNNREWNVINCKLILKPNSGRLHTANADCFHISSGFIGPWIQGGLFEGYSDDAMNLKHTRREILEVQANNQLKLKFNVVVGDTLRFYNPRQGIDLGTANVTAVQNLGNNEFSATLSRSINITTIGGNDHPTDDRCYVENRSSESFVLRNNVFRNARRYGLLIQGTYGLIENNTFENLSTGGIKIRNAAGWGEGFAAKHITIHNNVFRNCGYDTTYLEDSKSAAITVYLSKLVANCSPSQTSQCNVVPTDWIGIENITITNNDISYNKKGIDMQNVNTGLIQCNTINPNSSFSGTNLGGIVLKNNANVIQANDNCNLSINEFKKMCWDVSVGNNSINLGNTCEMAQGTWTIYDVSGRLIKSNQFETNTSNSGKIDISSLNSGVYLFHITSNQGSISKKILKK